MLESLSNTVKGLQAVRLPTLLKIDTLTGISEPAVRRCSAKKVLSNNSQNSQEKICAGVSFQIKFRSNRSQMFFKIVGLKNFIGKLLRRSLV